MRLLLHIASTSISIVSQVITVWLRHVLTTPVVNERPSITVSIGLVHVVTRCMCVLCVCKLACPCLCACPRARAVILGLEQWRLDYVLTVAGQGQVPYCTEVTRESP